MAPPTTGLNTGGLPRKGYKGRGKNNSWVMEQYVKQIARKKSKSSSSRSRTVRRARVAEQWGKGTGKKD
eukprot:460341-Pelagomonas_calceolata.AAC.1